MTGNGVSPIVISDFSNFNGTGLSTGDQVTVIGVQGNTAANGTYTVTVLNPCRFDSMAPRAMAPGSSGTGAYFAPSSGNGLQTGDRVAITSPFSFGVTSTPGFDIDGVYDITVISPTEFLLDGTEGETDVPTDFFFGNHCISKSPTPLP